MVSRLSALLCFFAICLSLAAQTDEPELVSGNIPKYPPLARQARIEGILIRFQNHCLTRVFFRQAKNAASHPFRGASFRVPSFRTPWNPCVPASDPCGRPSLPTFP